MIRRVLSAALVAVATARCANPAGHPDRRRRISFARRLKRPLATRAHGMRSVRRTTPSRSNALASFSAPADAPWRALLSADGLLENGQHTDAFGLYRAALDALPSMVTIHESIARIYERTGTPQWAAIERAKVRLEEDACTTRRAMCEFRAARYRSSLEAAINGVDAESRYWTARAANELALAAFRHLDTIADSPERRSVRAATAQARERYVDAVTELKAAVRLAPQQPEFQFNWPRRITWRATTKHARHVDTVAGRLSRRWETAEAGGASLVQLQLQAKRCRFSNSWSTEIPMSRAATGARTRLPAIGRLPRGDSAARTASTATPMAACTCSSRARIRKRSA